MNSSTGQCLWVAARALGGLSYEHTAHAAQRSLVLLAEAAVRAAAVDQPAVFEGAQRCYRQKR